MRLKSARAAWHDCYMTGKPNTMIETLQLGTFVQKTAKASSTDAAIHAWLAGKVQHAITTLPHALQCFGNYLYKPEFTIDDLETAHEAVKVGLLLKYAGEQWSDAKLERTHYLIFAAMETYKSLVVRGKDHLPEPKMICDWLNCEKGIYIDSHNWKRDFDKIYQDIRAICNDLDKNALVPISKLIKEFEENKMAA